jgi:thiol:disulfide interchange protein DsbA
MFPGMRLGAVLLAGVLAACSGEPAPATQAAPEVAPTASAPSSSPATSTQAPTISASESQESGAAAAEPTEKGDTTLEKVVTLPAAAQLPSGRWTAGTNYRVISPVQPTNAGPGKVEVMEIFWYACPHCYTLEPYMEAWLKQKPAYIEFVRVPVMWGPIHRAHAQLFYTLKALGKLDALHERAFQDVHKLVEQQKLPLVAPGDDSETLHLMTNWARANGIDAKTFADAWNSFSVNKDLQSAEEITRRYRVESVPLVIINGKYVSDVGMAGGQAKLVSLIDDLATSEKRH